MSTPVLSLKDAVVRYDRLTAVDGVSLELRQAAKPWASSAKVAAGNPPSPGPSLGPAACGRYTDHRRRETPQGMPTQRRGDLQRRIQLLFQDPTASLSPRMTVDALLAEPLKIRPKMHTWSWTRITALAQSIGLGEQLLSRYPHQLSGGQARRVALARVLSPNPPSSLRDEPTAGLDISHPG